MRHDLAELPCRLLVTGSLSVPPALACARINPAPSNRAMIFLVLSCLETDIDSRACQVTDSYTVQTARVQSREGYNVMFFIAVIKYSYKTQLFLKFLRNYSIIKVNNSSDIM